MGARAYKPAEGRFSSVDPIFGGCANAYTYVFGDPFITQDLDGQDSCGQKHHSHWWDPFSWSSSTWTKIGVGVVFVGVVAASGGILAGAGAGGILFLVSAETSIDAGGATALIGGGVTAFGGATTIVAANLRSSKKPDCGN